MFARYILPLTCLLASAAQAGAAEPRVIQPVTPWAVALDDDRCRISRVFGEGEDRTLIYLEQLQPAASFTWVIAGSPVEKLRPANRSLPFDPEVRFGSASAPVPAMRYYDSTLGDYGASIEGSYPDVTRSDPDLPAGVDQTGDDRVSLSLEDGARMEWIELSRRDSYRFATGSLAPAFENLNLCMRMLGARWGVDVATTVVRPEVKNLGEVARYIQQHYPAKALGRGQQATLAVRLVIGAGGEIENCTMIDVSQATNFDGTACEAYEKHAEFTPARDAGGRGVKSVYVNKIVYQVR